MVDLTRRMILDRAGPDASEAAILPLIGVNRGYLESSFARIVADYGSVDGYLAQAVGLADRARAKALLAPPIGAFMLICCG